MKGPLFGGRDNVRSACQLDEALALAGVHPEPSIPALLFIPFKLLQIFPDGLGLFEGREKFEGSRFRTPGIFFREDGNFPSLRFQRRHFRFFLL